MDNSAFHADASFLTGERILLRAFEESDIPLVHKWANDPETRALTSEVFPSSLKSTTEYFERLRTDPYRVWFTVALKESGRPIGQVGILRIYHPWRTADLTMIIGETELQGKGYGREAMELALDYAFGALGLHRIAIAVVGFNARAIAFYEKLGFKREGVQRDGYFHGHGWHDFVMMSLLEHEFRAARGIAEPGTAAKQEKRIVSHDVV